MTKKVRFKKLIFPVLCVIIAAFFITDTVRTKAFALPPVFSVKAVTYADGFGGCYYGAGYKIIRKYNINDCVDEYFITLWILPTDISL